MRTFGANTDFNPGDTGSSQFFFVSDTSNPNGITTRVWASDGTSAGTVLVHDFGKTEFRVLGMYNNIEYFSAFATSTARELWSSDGTVSGTSRLKSNGAQLSSQSGFELVGGTNGNALIVIEPQGANGQQQLLGTNGTVAGTHVLTTTSPDYHPLGTIGNFQLFAKSLSTGVVELWGTDGTVANTKKLNLGTNVTKFTRLVDINGFALFNVGHGISGTNNMQLWASNGTTTGTISLATSTSQDPFFDVGNLNGSELIGLNDHRANNST